MPIADDQNSLKGGRRGPTLLEDFILREKIFHFDHERIPERVVHARGYGAHGFFETYESLSDITRADLFQRKGEKTPTFVRFSTVAGNKGSPDLARDVRGFATKFYTKEGNWDLVGNNIPVFFIQDAIKFPDMVHAAKQEPDRGFPQAQTAHDNFWDFISLTPECMHMIMWIMSDRTIPRSFRFMEGFGVHTFRLVNADGKSTFVKFHWKPKQGMQSVVWNEALKINGFDPDFHRRDLWDAIGMGDYPEWELGLQLFDEDFAAQLPVRRARRHQDHPRGGAAGAARRAARARPRASTTSSPRPSRWRSAPRTSCPGIDFTEDPLLQGRNFSYLDTQLKRLGSPNFHEIPINRARMCPVHNFQQDGHMRMTVNKGRANYEPNSWGEGPRETPERGYRSYPTEVSGPKLRVRSESFSRPLQPGAAVLRQPDRDRAAPHRGRPHLRAEQGRDPGDPRPRRLAPPQHRPGPGDEGGRRPAAEADARARPRRPADAAGPGAVAGAEHPQEPPDLLRRPQGRGARDRRHRRRRSWRRSRRRSPRRVPC